MPARIDLIQVNQANLLMVELVLAGYEGAPFDIMALPWAFFVWTEGPVFSADPRPEGSPVLVMPTEFPLDSELTAEGTPGTFHYNPRRVALKAVDEGRYLSAPFLAESLPSRFPSGLPMTMVFLVQYDPTTVVPRPTILSVRGAPAYATFDINLNGSVRTNFTGGATVTSLSGPAGVFGPHLVLLDFMPDPDPLAITVDNRARVQAANGGAPPESLMDRVILGPGSGQGYVDVDYIFVGAIPTAALTAAARNDLLTWAQAIYGVPGSAGWQPGEVEYRQTSPSGPPALARVPWGQRTIFTFDGPLNTNFRASGILYEAGGGLIGAATLDYNPATRPLIKARGLARSGGRAHFVRDPLRIGASGLAVSGGLADLELVTINHRIRADGWAFSGGSAALDLRTMVLRVTAAGTALSGGSADLGLGSALAISAAGLARSGGSSRLIQGSTITAGAAGVARSGGRARLRIRPPRAIVRRLSRAFPLQATIEHRGPVDVFRDEYGDVPVVVTSTEEVACNLQPQWSREQTANADTQTESFNLYLPAGVELGGHDRVVIGGVGYEVYGPPGEWVDFDRRPHHVEAVLRRVA